jgi:hypothetical protein
MQKALQAYISNSREMYELSRKFNVVSKIKLRKDSKNRLGVVRRLVKDAAAKKVHDGPAGSAELQQQRTEIL